MTNPDESDTFPTYSETFQEYLDSQDWIGAAEAPLVHHVKALCRRLDAAGLDQAAMSSAYLQAIERLNKRRPGPRNSGGSDGGDPAQSDIFDFID